jgi:hypothetical protein
MRVHSRDAHILFTSIRHILLISSDCFYLITAFLSILSVRMIDCARAMR